MGANISHNTMDFGIPTLFIIQMHDKQRIATEETRETEVFRCNRLPSGKNYNPPTESWRHQMRSEQEKSRAEEHNVASKSQLFHDGVVLLRWCCVALSLRALRALTFWIRIFKLSASLPYEHAANQYTIFLAWWKPMFSIFQSPFFWLGVRANKF